MHNFYQILGVSKDASFFAIKKAYREKALFEHPDKGGDVHRMILLTKAFKTLSDRVERKNYDQEWEVFDASYDTEVRLTPSDCLPTAGIAFSKTFKQQHVQFVKQYRAKPLHQNQSSSYLKAFSSDLYSCDGGDLFSFIQGKEQLEYTEIDIGLLSREKAIEHFINFLKGHYYGKNLKDLSKAFYQKIKLLENSGQQAGSEFQLYCGIYTIFLVAAKKRTPTAKILFALNKIIEYAKHNVDETINFMAPLLQSKYFRSLFSQALHYYWLSEDGDGLDESNAEAFDGQATIENFIESLKSKLSESRMASKSNKQVAELLRQARLLCKLEQDLGKSADTLTAVFYREKAFHLLDWLPAVRGIAEHAIAVNTLLQIGTTLQKAAIRERNPVIRMADEKLAVQIYITAVSISHYAKPDVELYACLQSVKFLLSCRYNDSEFGEILKAIQHRTLWIADLFPFFLTPQSNANFLAKENKTLVLMRQLLHELIDKMEDQKNPAEMDHSHVRVFYQAYEACLKNWYEESCDLEKEKKFRQRLMQELLVSKQWKVDNVDYNLKAPWPLIDIDEQGWTCSNSSILSSAQEIGVPRYKTIHGVEFNYTGSGEINFILDYCEDSEIDKCLLTSYDLSELFQRQIMSAVFSLDPVDPDMTYHPFNQIFYKPSSLHHSQLLHAMFIADYLLKFLTIGQEVQRRDPYELRSLDEITSRLPDHLKKVIYDFHASNHEESVNRFWIESEEVEFAIDDSKYGINLFSIGNIRMVVKHKKMERNSEGKLVDKEGKNEGWDCYVLNQEQEQELCSGQRIIKDSALIVIEESWELIFWENQKITYRFTLQEYRQDLILLSKLQRDSQEKVKSDDSESLRQIYRIVTKAAEKTRMPNGYSSEFTFAQEFTKYYDEFAIYFPEFGRLRELSKAASLVKIMAGVRESNKNLVNLHRRRLNYYKETRGLQFEKPEQVEEYNYWQTTRLQLNELVRKSVTERFDELRSKTFKQKIEQTRQEQLNDLRRQIGPLSFHRESPEIRDALDKSYEQYKSDMINRHAWVVTREVFMTNIDHQIPELIEQLSIEKKKQCHAQLLKIFNDVLDKVSAGQLISGFLEGNDQQLREHLVYYDVSQVAKQLYPEQTIETLKSALNNSLCAINEIVDCESKKALKGHEKQLNAELIGREKMEQSFTDLDFGVDTEEINLEGNCLWVPASFRHNVEGRHSRTVYGGVSVCPRLRECVRESDRQALLRQTHEAGKTVQRNRLNGNAASTYFKRNVVDKYYDTDKYIVAEQYYLRTPVGGRYLDTVIIDRATGKILKAFEVKTGESPYTFWQQVKDEWLYREGILQTPVKLRRFNLDPNWLYN